MYKFIFLLLILSGASLLSAQTVHDPMRPPYRVAAQLSDAPAQQAVLQSTIVSPRNRSAVISGKRYAIGDKVGDETLTAITNGRVTLNGPNGARDLRLNSSRIKTPVKS